MARLLDHFHGDLDSLARLTDRQITDLYFHKRNKDGQLVVPTETEIQEKKPNTYEEEVAGLFNLVKLLGMADADYESLKQKLDKKYGK